MSMRRATAATLLGAVLAAAALSSAAAAPTRSQVFFRDRLLADAGTSTAIKRLLRSGGGFVDRSTVFRDLTGDDRDDAVVRVHSGGADGVVAIYVLSTARDPDGELRVLYRTQRVRRGSTAVRDGVLTWRTHAYAEGEEPCCPSTIVETELAWDDDAKRFTIADRRTIPPPPPNPE